MTQEYWSAAMTKNCIWLTMHNGHPYDVWLTEREATTAIKKYAVKDIKNWCVYGLPIEGIGATMLHKAGVTADFIDAYYMDHLEE